MKRVYLFKRYERLWHWLQALLVLTLLATGFTIHGTLSLPNFETRAQLARAGGSR